VQKTSFLTALSPLLSLSVTGKSLASVTTDKNLDGLSGFHFCMISPKNIHLNILSTQTSHKYCIVCKKKGKQPCQTFSHSVKGQDTSFHQYQTTLATWAQHPTVLAPILHVQYHPVTLLELNSTDESLCPGL
jgi:hypothetical protein